MAKSEWDKSVLKAVFWRGLNSNILTKMACHDDKASIDSLIKLDNLLQDRKPRFHRLQNPSIPTHKLMDIGTSQLTQAKKAQQRRNGLCFYCGQSAHPSVTCPLKSYTPMVRKTSSFCQSPQVSTQSFISWSPFTLWTLIWHSGKSHVFTELIASGSAGNVIDRSLAIQYQIPIVNLPCPVQLRTIDGCPIGTRWINFCTEPLHMQTSSLYNEII